MAENVFLNSYVIRVKKRFSRNSDPLDNFENGKDIYPIVKNYLASLQAKFIKDAIEKKTTLFDAFQADDANRSMAGTIKIGEYGFERDTLDTVLNKTGKIPKEQSILSPNYFLLSMPTNTRKGLALFCQYKNFSAFGTVSTLLADFMAKNHPNYLCCLDPLYPLDQVERLLNHGALKTLRFIRHRVPSELENLVADGAEEIKGQTEMIVHVKQSSYRQAIHAKIMEILNSDRDIKTLYEFENFDYNEVRASITIGGQKRDVNLTDLSRIRINYDISSSVAFDADGNPSFSSLHSNAVSLLSDLRSQLGE